MEEELIQRLRTRAKIRRGIETRKSVQLGEPDRIADLLEEAAAALGLRRWQDISTAPKDGTKILVTYFPCTSHRIPYNLVWWGQVRNEAHGWKQANSKYCRYQPTHWQPLVPPDVV